MTKKNLWRLINSEIDEAIAGGIPDFRARKTILDQHQIKGDERLKFFKSRRVKKRRHWSYLQASIMRIPRRSLVKAEG
jgi:hypothetical protein